MDFFAIVGVIVCVVIAVVAAWLAIEIAGNVYGGIKGAYRLAAIHRKRGKTGPLPHWRIIRHGVRAWGGQRYRGGFGSYYQIGGMKVPVDGRDPIERDRFYGA